MVIPEKAAFPFVLLGDLKLEKDNEAVSWFSKGVHFGGSTEDAMKFKGGHCSDQGGTSRAGTEVTETGRDV